jgi:hypothetical protein
MPHPAVHHPNELLTKEKAWFSRLNDGAASHLAIIFGSVWIVWIFFIWPLLAQHFGMKVQSETSYYAQSWIQLFALPLFVYIGNKLQKSSDAQSDVQHQALTHIAIVGDQVKELIVVNTDLTKQIHEFIKGTQ